MNGSEQPRLFDDDPDTGEVSLKDVPSSSPTPDPGESGEPEAQEPTVGQPAEAAPSEPDLSEPEASEPGGGDSEAGDSEAGEAEAGDSEAGEAEPGEAEPGEAEADEAEADQAEADQADTVEVVATEPEAVETEAFEPKAVETEALGAEALEPEAPAAKAEEPGPAAPEGVCADAPRSEAVAAKAAATEPAVTEPAVTEAAATEARAAGTTEVRAAPSAADEADEGTADEADEGTADEADEGTADEADEDLAEGGAAAVPTQRVRARSRLLAAMRPKANRGQVLAALLCAGLGFGLVTQLRTQDSSLDQLRQSDLVVLLQNVNNQAQQLQDQEQAARAAAEKLANTTTANQELRDQARTRILELGVLSGTVAATGPGIQLKIDDPKKEVGAAQLLDALQELRDAGAEAVQINDVRVVASTSFEDLDGGVRVDDTPVTAPYTFLVIGDPQTLDAAMRIPGGVLDTLAQKGATGTVNRRDTLTVDALHTVKPPQYARPAPDTGS